MRAGPDSGPRSHRAWQRAPGGRQAVEVGAAWRAGNEDALRGELRALSTEADLLANLRRLLPSPVAARQRVAAERDPGGRMS